MAPTRLSAAEIAALDPYKFIAVIGKRVIHSGCRASMESLLRRAAITADTRVLDFGCGWPRRRCRSHAVTAPTSPRVDVAPVMLERAVSPAGRRTCARWPG